MTFLMAVANFSLFTFHFSLLTSCGVDSDRFRLTGEFKSFNQGELYLYSTDGSHHDLDTIAIINGRFTYEVTQEKPITYVLVFPNYSELPVFGEAGCEVSVTGDASHLKELEVKGTEENELMTAFRMQTNQQTPPEVLKTAAQFINDHPQTLASIYILNKYFIQTLTPDYAQALDLIGIIERENPNGQQAARLKKQLEGLKNFHDNGTLPSFSATDINGRPVSNADLRAKVNVINTWASWNYDSQNILRKLQRMRNEHGSDISIVSICLDASQKECRKFLDRDSIKWSCICDGQMWETPVLTQLGLYFVPDNIIADNQGRIIAHSLNTNELDRKIESLFGP